MASYSDRGRGGSGGGGGGRSRGKDKKVTKTMLVGPFRMAFPALWEPEEDDFGNERYKMTALFPPDYDTRDLEDAMYDVMEAEFGPEREWPSGRNDMLPLDKLYEADKKKYQGFLPGWHALSMTAKDQPGLIGPDKREVMSKREIYGGRWARAQVSITTYDNKSKGVGVYINHVQLLEHDEEFSGRGRAEDAFDEYEVRDRSERNDRRRGRDDDSEDTRNTSRRGDSDRRAEGGRDSDRYSRRDRDDDTGRESRSRRDDGERDRGNRDSRRDEEGRSRETSRSRGRGDEDRGSRGRGRDDDGDDRRGSRDDGGRRSGREDRQEARGRRSDDRDEDRGRDREERRGTRSDDRDERRGSRDREDDRGGRSSSGARRSSVSSDEWN